MAGSVLAATFFASSFRIWVTKYLMPLADIDASLAFAGGAAGADGPTSAHPIVVGSKVPAGGGAGTSRKRSHLKER